MTKQILTALALLVAQTCVVSAGYIDITRPGDAIARVDGFNQNDGAAGTPPGAEGEENAFNDIGQKYLNFLDISSGVAVTPSGNPDNLPVTGLRLYTANDAEARDPASFQLSGSNDGLTGPWTYIASGNIALPSERNAGGGAVVIPPEGNLDAHHLTLMFDNAATFDHYQIVFPTLKDAVAANSMQIAEVELLVDAIPEPSSAILLGLGSMLVGCLRRRRR